MNARELTDTLHGQWKGERGFAHCPAHKEKTGSLCITQGTKHILVHCFGGCTQLEVLGALRERGINLTGRVDRTSLQFKRAMDNARDLKAAPVEKIQTLNLKALTDRWESTTTREQYMDLAESLGVRVESVIYLGACWATAYKAWAFPMRNVQGDVIGIRIRTKTGKKFAVTGSHGGLFYSDCVNRAEADEVWIPEGPTDTAAVMSVGLVAVGRPSCNSGLNLVRDYLIKTRAKRVVIVSDNDVPGKKGAEALQEMLTVPSKVWIPPAKDVRQFILDGASKQTIQALTSGLQWEQPKLRREHT
jgi:DNA primase